jgi:TPR repeat protein
MKLRAVLILGFCTVGFCHLSRGYPTGDTPSTGGLVNNDTADAALAQQQYLYAIQARQEAEQANVAADQQAILQRLFSKDPWRLINGATNYAGGDGWLEFQGLPQETSQQGTIFKGKWGAPLTIAPFHDEDRPTIVQEPAASPSYTPKGDSPDAQGGNRIASGVSESRITHTYYGNDVFIVANFPYPSAQPYKEMLAFDAGYYTFTNVNNQVVTIHKLDYGMPCVKTWSPEELAAIKARAEAPQKAAEAKALKLDEDLADKGDPFGLLRMGERYRDGDGVDRDMVKARAYLSKAAAAGSPTAADEIKNLPNEPVAASK